MDRGCPWLARCNGRLGVHIVLPDNTTGSVSSRYLVSDTPFVNLPTVTLIPDYRGGICIQTVSRPYNPVYSGFIFHLA